MSQLELVEGRNFSKTPTIPSEQMFTVRSGIVRSATRIRLEVTDTTGFCRPQPRPDDRPAASEIRCRGEVRQPRSAALPPGHQLVNRSEAGADLSNTQGRRPWAIRRSRLLRTRRAGSL